MSMQLWPNEPLERREVPAAITQRDQETRDDFGLR